MYKIGAMFSYRCGVATLSMCSTCVLGRSENCWVIRAFWALYQAEALKFRKAKKPREGIMSFLLRLTTWPHKSRSSAQPLQVFYIDFTIHGFYTRETLDIVYKTESQRPKQNMPLFEVKGEYYVFSPQII